MRRKNTAKPEAVLDFLHISRREAVLPPEDELMAWGALVLKEAQKYAPISRYSWARAATAGGPQSGERERHTASPIIIVKKPGRPQNTDRRRDIFKKPNNIDGQPQGAKIEISQRAYGAFAATALTRISLKVFKIDGAAYGDVQNDPAGHARLYRRGAIYANSLDLQEPVADPTNEFLAGSVELPFDGKRRIGGLVNRQIFANRVQSMARDLAAIGLHSQDKESNPNLWTPPQAPAAAA